MAQAGPEAGLTVAELLVVVSLLAIFLPTAFMMVTSMQRQQATNSARLEALGQAQLIVDRLTRDVRAAVAPTSTSAAFAAADGNDITFYADLQDPNGPTRVHAYTVAGTSPELRFELTPPDPPPASAPGNWVYTGPPQAQLSAAIDASAPVFAFYGRDGAAQATPITSVAGLRSIDGVGINLTTRVRAGAPPTVIQTVVHVRNVDYNPA